VSISYYLHSTDFPESVHLGNSSGDRWTSRVSSTAGPADHPWRTTPELFDYLTAQGQREHKHPPWVADEYGRIYSPADMAEFIRRHGEHRELGHAFS
jgi:hypothetical protein